ncbi:MAG TPA: circadian clock KaiB family protein, partial [Polyangiaceae bacterium]|nr:circadian clock KaiB family protein [Polyangiaceae bacterium]
MLASNTLKSGWSLSLFVSGRSGTSLRALRNLTALCHGALAGDRAVTIVDVHEQPDLAESQRILWTPTLVRNEPAPTRRIVGDLSNRERLFEALDLSERPVRTSTASPPSKATSPVVSLQTRVAASPATRDAQREIVSDEAFRTMVMRSPGGVLLLDGHGHVLFGNPAAERLFADSPAPLLGRFLGIPWMEGESPLRLRVTGDRVVDAHSTAIDWRGRLLQMVLLHDVTAYAVAERQGAELVSELLAVTQKLGRDANV